jgi:hypothetical protein
MMWGLTRRGWAYPRLVREWKMEIPVDMENSN